MNMEMDIITSLENKGYDDLTKIRWIYLYVCQMFSYDTRFLYANKELKKEIYDKNVSIKSVEEFEIVCYTISKVLADALNICGYDAEVIKENNEYFSHAYVIVKHNNYILKLDPTKRHDITRVKMHSTTLGFTSLSDVPFFEDELQESDKIIKENSQNINLEEFYNNDSIKKLVEIIEESAKKRNLSEKELFFEKLEYIISLVNSRTDFKRYDDIDYYYAYLLKKFNINKCKIVINNKIISEGKYPVKPALFFKKDDKTMKDIINISYVKYDTLSPIRFYVMAKEGETYKIREIFKDEALELLKKYHNPTCQYIYEMAALNLEKDKKKKIVL